MRVAFLDNYDSFTFNLVHYLEVSGAQVSLYNPENLLDCQTDILNHDAVLIGPGPNSPKDSGQLMDIIPVLVAHKMPILGVCLGHQALGEYFNMELTLANCPVHGKATLMHFHDSALFTTLVSPILVGRYHSLKVVNTEDSNDIEILGESNGEIMAFSHRTLPIFGVQFHPESILTPQGLQIIQNWLNTIDGFAG